MNVPASSVVPVSPRPKIRAIVICLGLALGAPPATHAICANARLMVSSYVYTPGTVYSYGKFGDTVTDQFAGSWWALGFGDPSSSLGVDSGTFPAREWLQDLVDGGFPPFISTTWAVDPRIDGCIDHAPTSCVGLQLTDLDPATGQPVFAVISAVQDRFLNFTTIGLGARMELAPLPPPKISDRTRIGDDKIMVTLAPLDPAAFDAGSFLDPLCTTSSGEEVQFENLVPGVRWFYRALLRGSLPPSDWNVITGGWVDSGVTSLLESTPTITVPCSGDRDIYLAYVLLNESNMLVEHTSESAPREECGPNLAEPDPRIRLRPANRERHPR